LSKTKGVHPRHSPRTFPLGLLAPRCLGFLLILALPLCGAGARAGGCLGGGRNPPPSFASSRQGSTNRLSQPPFSFSYRLYVVSLSLLNFSIARLRRRSSFSHGRPSGNVRGSNTNALDPPSRSRAISPPWKKRKRRGCSLKTQNPLRGFVGGCAFRSPLCVPFCCVRIPSVVSSTQALFTSAAFSKHPFYRRPRPCFWESALAATDFTRADECPLRRSLLAFVATRRLVVFLCAIFVKINLII